MILLAMVVFVSGCATKTPSTPENFVLSPDFERDLDARYQELREQGIHYINADSQYEESRKALLKAYNTRFFQKIADCQAVSLGLQSMLLQKTEQEFCESLLAASAKNWKEFYKMFLWYEDQRDSAKNFLQLLEEDSRLEISVKRGDSKQLGLVSRELGIKLCSPKVTLDLLQEFGEFF